MRALVVLLPLALLAAGSRAQAGDGWVAVDAAVLERTRGGFTTSTGLVIALGIERRVSVNGELVASSLNGAGALAVLVQRGSGNVFAATLGPGAAVIQNSLDNQTIRTETVINATVNSAAVLRDMNFQQSMRDAASAGAGSH